VFYFYSDTFYTGCSINAAAVKKHLLRTENNGQPETKLMTCDANVALGFLKDKQLAINLFVTDPPYGFNTNVRSSIKLASLYRDIIFSMVERLADGGQLILCLPDMSQNGQRIHSFTTKNFVINSIFAAARKLDEPSDYSCELIQPSFIHPSPSRFFEPPYYWESEKTLRRAVLHFQIKRGYLMRRIQKLHFSITINAPKEKVWDTMLDKETYKAWVNAAWPGSYYEGEWKEDSDLKFIGPDGSGTKAMLVEHVPYEHSFVKHVAVLESGGKEDTTSDNAKSWIGTTERYTFTEKDGVTELAIDIETTPEWEKMFNDGWPTALRALKELCRSKS
jgi:uncharacterized protein YndB with AHSA1/START domain